MKNTARFFLPVMLLFFFNILGAQTPGVIYKPAGNALGKAVLDPNGDNFASLSTDGYISGDDSGESELRMIAMPSVSPEPVNDLSTGAGGGHTDIVSNSNGNSLYVLVRTVDGVDYLIVRFRLGGASTAAKGYSLLLDTDGVFGSQYSANNPGFEKEIVLETGNRVAIYSHNASGPTLTHSYNVDNHHQRSVAQSTVSGNPDYFYDFFVPLAALNAQSLVRIVGVTVTSAQSGLSGTVSDFNGINDAVYRNNRPILFDKLVQPFPPVFLDDLREDFAFPPLKTSAPTITGTLNTASTSITGVSQEANGTVITVFRNGVLLGTTTVTSNNWVLTGVSGLQAGDLITATAQATGKSVSNLSMAKEVTIVQTCYVPRPVVTTSSNGSQTINGTWSDGTPITAGSVQIRAYIANTATTPHGYTEIFQAGNAPLFVGTNGAWTFTANLTQPQFTSNTYFFTATKAGCTSDYSNPLNLNSAFTVTTAPTLLTTPILANTAATSITVRNNHTAGATLYLYVNGNLRGTSTVTAAGANHIFSIPNLIAGDVVYARAIGGLNTDRLSAASSLVTVTASTVQSAAPQLTGTYIAGTGQTVSGTSGEAPGTLIRVFSGATLLGTTTVTAFNTWSLANVTLVSGAVLTATAQADGKTQSGASNAVTVAASAPAAPTISGNYVVGNTVVSGTGGTGTVTVFVDGAPIGTTIPTSGNWSLSGIAATELYRGAVITATNTVSGIRSAFSAPRIVAGVVSFCITDVNGNAITDKNSGETFTIRITAIDGATCPGNVFTSFNGKVVLYSDTWIQPAGETANFVNGSLQMEVSLGGLGATAIRVINPADPTASGSAPLSITNPAIWVGTNSTDFNMASNWFYNYVPAAGADIQFAANAVNHCVLDSHRILGNLDFNLSTYKLDLNGHLLELRGDVSNSNTTTGSFISDATGSMDIFGSGVMETLYFANNSGLGNLLINRTAGMVSLGSPLSVFTLLSLENGTLQTNGMLTLKSTSITGTAQVAPVTGEISGPTIVERYVPARRAFRLLSSPVTTIGSIRDNWQEGQNNTTTTSNSNTVPGYGIHITGSTTGANGFDATPSGNPSLFLLNNATQQWGAVTNTDSNTLTAGVPYRVLVRGDRSINVTLNSTTPTITTMRTTGELHTGAYSPVGLNSDNGAFNFIGNPYQAAVDMTAVLDGSTGLDRRYYYIWDPTLGGTATVGQPGGRGAYVAVDVLENSNNNVASQANKYLQPMQAAFVQSNGTGTTELTFRENNKAINQPLTTTFNVETRIDLQLYSEASYQNNDTPADGVSIRFSEQDSNVSDYNDATKFFNLDENLATHTEGNLHSIERRALPQEEDIIPLFTNQYRHSSYVFVATVSMLQGFTAYLRDHYTGDEFALENDQQTLYPFTIIAGNDGSTSTDRFEIFFKEHVLTIYEPGAFTGITLYPNPTENGNFRIAAPGLAGEQLKVSLVNLLGQQLYSDTKETDANGNLPLHIPGLSAGVYIVKLSDNSGNIFTAKLIHN